MTWTVYYATRRGGSGVRSFVEHADVVAFIRTLRAPARVLNAQKRHVGGVERHPGGADDQRIRWLWWLE